MEMMYPPLSSSDKTAKTPWGNTFFVRTYPLPMYVPSVQLAAAAATEFPELYFRLFG